MLTSSSELLRFKIKTALSIEFIWIKQSMDYVEVEAVFKTTLTDQLYFLIKQNAH